MPAAIVDGGRRAPALLPLLVFEALRHRTPDADSSPIGDALRDATRLAWSGAVLGAHRVGLSIAPAAAPAAEALRLSVVVARAVARLAVVVPSDGAWIEAFAAAWRDHVDALAEVARRGATRSWDSRRVGRCLAPVSALAQCAAAAGGRSDLARTLGPLLDETAGIYLGLTALEQVCSDRAAGVADLAASVAPPELWAVEGAASARRAASTWSDLGFATIGALVDTWAAALDPLAPSPAAPAPPSSPPARSVATALRAGLAALADDPEAREAREIYRWGFLEINPLVSTVFPHGTILENRLHAGDAHPSEVDALLRRYEDNRFHYFDTPSALPFDIDTFGLIARLASRTSSPVEARRRLEQPLGWVLANVGAGGDVPVFLTHGVDAGDGRRYIATFGNSCAAVQANLLLGLLALPEPRPPEAILRIGARLCARFGAEGAAAFTHYDVLYGAHVVHEALDAWEAAVGGARREVADARSLALELLARACQTARPHPLELALRWIATARSSARSLRHQTWLTDLVEAQELDGGWPAAPFYRVPSRGNYGETYASRLLTTSFACRALADAVAS